MNVGDPPSSGSNTQEVPWKASLHTLLSGGLGCVQEGTDLSHELLSQVEKHGDVSSPSGTFWQPGDLQLIRHLPLAALRCHQL